MNPNMSLHDMMAELRAAGDMRPAHQIIQGMIEETDPDLWRTYYPRTYENIGQYHSPKILATALAGMTAASTHMEPEDLPNAYRLMYAGLRPLVERKMPLYFLAPRLLDAIRMTEFRDPVNWVEMNLPYEEGFMILPRGGFVHPRDGEAAVLFWSRKQEKTNYPGPIPGTRTIQLANSALSFTCLCPFAKDNTDMVWYDGNLHAGSRPLLHFKSMFVDEDGEDISMRLSHPIDHPLEDDIDKQFLENAGHILFGTLLALTSRPDLLEQGRLMRTVKPKQASEAPKEFWSPNVIGANYKTPTRAAVAAGGTHASPRIHWRRGHFTNQPHGPGRQLRKQLWIEPMLVAGPKDTKE